MSLSASMWTGVSGLKVHGERMGILGNNIANVGTIGFKGARMNFEDFIHQDVNTANGRGQVGRGATLSSIYTDYSQGSFETTNEATDLGIGGRGFFKVKPKNSRDEYFTRAGNFRFDKEGFLVEPHGYVLQGWRIENDPSLEVASPLFERNIDEFAEEYVSPVKGVGAPQNIRLNDLTIKPKATERIRMITNLSGDLSSDHTASTTDPFFSLGLVWDGTREPPIGDTQYSYTDTIDVFDEGGGSHDISFFFDKVTVSNSRGLQYFEFIVTMDPVEDGRTFNVETSNGNIVPLQLDQTSAAGLLMMGTMVFDPTGQLKNMSAFTLDPDLNVPNSNGNINIKNLSHWVPAEFNTEGHPLVTPNFSRSEHASHATASNARNIGINFGLANNAPGTGFVSRTDATFAPSNAGAILADGGTIPAASNAAAVGLFHQNVPGFADPVLESRYSTAYAGDSSTLLPEKDGYSFGFLQSVSVTRDGILVGRYSNNENLEMFQITLYDFANKWGLYRDGGNLYKETRDSGDPASGPANANGLGYIAGNSLELSNVDLAVEFTKMITTERGFQANSKVITTTDTMLSTVIMMKR